LAFFVQTSLTSGDLLFLVEGAGRTLLLSAGATLFGTALGVILGVVRAEAGWVSNGVVGTVVDVIRSIPLLIQLIIFNSFVAILGHPMSAFQSGLVVLSIYMAVNCTEVVRSGVRSVPLVTRRAARSLGLTYVQDLHHIVAPLGLRTAFPAWAGVVLAIVKDSALVSVLGYFELLKSSQTLITRTQEPLLILVLVGLFYFVLSFPLSRLAGTVEQVLQR
jgi:His/Glu/Gln/Arg/opine family amino acid ABC transporter permease subunit